MLNLLIIIQVKCNHSDCSTNYITHAYYLCPAILPKISSGTIRINILNFEVYKDQENIYSNKKSAMHGGPPDCYPLCCLSIILIVIQ